MTKEEKLKHQIQLAVSEYISAGLALANTAVKHAFQDAGGSARPAQRLLPKTPRKVPNRRTASELAELGNKLVAEITASPGESMKILSSALGLTPIDLQTVVQRERRANRLRVVGKRQFARYFPLVESVSTDAT